MKNPYMPEEVRIIDKRVIRQHVVLFRINTHMNPLPGQFVQLSLIGIGEFPVPLCSYNNKYIELLVKNTYLFSIKKRDPVGIRGPYSVAYPLDKMLGKNIIIIASETGMASLKSIVEYIEKHRRDYNEIKIFISFTNPGDEMFSEFLKQCGNKYNLNIAYGKAVTTLVKKSDIRAENAAVIICCPIVINNILREKGFSEQQIYFSPELDMKCGHQSVAGKYIQYSEDIID